MRTAKAMTLLVGKTGQGWLPAIQTIIGNRWKPHMGGVVLAQPQMRADCFLLTWHTNLLKPIPRQPLKAGIGKGTKFTVRSAKFAKLFEFLRALGELCGSKSGYLLLYLTSNCQMSLRTADLPGIVRHGRCVLRQRSNLPRNCYT